MKIVQSIYTSPSPRFVSTQKIVENLVGLEPGTVEIYENGSTLFYSQSHILPKTAGFKRNQSRMVGKPKDRSLVLIPAYWYKKYCSGCTHIRVYYTKIGLFVKPYYGDGG